MRICLQVHPSTFSKHAILGHSNLRAIVRRTRSLLQPTRKLSGACQLSGSSSRSSAAALLLGAAGACVCDRSSSSQHIER